MKASLENGQNVEYDQTLRKTDNSNLTYKTDMKTDDNQAKRYSTQMFGDIDCDELKTQPSEVHKSRDLDQLTASKTYSQKPLDFIAEARESRERNSSSNESSTIINEYKLS